MKKKAKLFSDVISQEELTKMWAVIEEIAKEKFPGLSWPQAQIEIVSAPQFIELYATNGMPVYYSHWSIGKRYEALREEYYRGGMGLAYEMIINTDPSIAYINENNTSLMNLLVLAHAVIGHGSFFKHNYAFKEWTNPSFIIPYLQYAKDYIRHCEDTYDPETVELTIDAAHILAPHSVFKYKHKRLNKQKIKEKKDNRNKIIQESQDFLYNKIMPPVSNLDPISQDKFQLPCENLLYFIEKNSQGIEEWQKEILRIVRTIEQYFYPQRLTKVMNEGWACLVHHILIDELYDRGYIESREYLEFLASHTSVCHQRKWDSLYYGGINPYTVGYEMFHHLYKKENSITPLIDIIESYKDDSFIDQFLDYELIKKLKLAELNIDSRRLVATVMKVHEEKSADALRQMLKNTYELDYSTPALEVVSYDEFERSFCIKSVPSPAGDLSDESQQLLLDVIEFLWGNSKSSIVLS